MASEIRKKISWRMKIVYVDPDCSSETTDEAESTITKPKQEIAAVDPKMR